MKVTDDATRCGKLFIETGNWDNYWVKNNGNNKRFWVIDEVHNP